MCLLKRSCSETHQGAGPLCCNFHPRALFTCYPASPRDGANCGFQKGKTCARLSPIRAVHLTLNSCHLRKQCWWLLWAQKRMLQSLSPGQGGSVTIALRLDSARQALHPIIPGSGGLGVSLKPSQLPPCTAFLQTTMVSKLSLVTPLMSRHFL